MKKNNIIKVLLITVLIVCLLTWIFPVTYYNSGLIEDARMQIGIFDLFSYPLIAFSYFGHILFYVLMIGGLYGVLNKIPAYKVLLNKIVKGFNGREWLFLVITIISISLLVSVTGLSFGIMILYPILISLILMLGYNKIVALLSTVGATMCGIIGTTYGESTVAYFDYLLSTSFLNDTKIKLVILVVTTGILIFNVLRYGKKVLNKVDDKKDALIPEDISVSKDKKVKILPLAIVFDVLVILLLVGFFPWSSVFEKFTLFDDMLSWVQSYELFGFPIFSKILGSINAFGSWSYSASQSTIVAALPCVILIATLILALIYGLKLNDTIDSILSGMKKAIVPGFIMLMTYMVLIISVYNPVQLTIIKPLIELIKDFGDVAMSFGGIVQSIINGLVLTVITVLGTFFNVDSMYLSNQVLPYLTSVVTATDSYNIISIILQSVYGLSLLFLPTSFILMGTLSYTGVSYGNWLKNIWKILLEIFIVLLIIFVILMML